MNNTEPIADNPTALARFLEQGYAAAIHFDDSYVTDLDPAHFAETIARYERGELWNVGVTVTDTLTGDTESLWGVGTEYMVATDEAGVNDFDEYGLEVALDLLRELQDGATWTDGRGNVVRKTKSRAQRMTERATELRAEASHLDAMAAEFPAE